MENNISSLSLQDLVALEKMISAVCKKYENLAQMNRYATSQVDQSEYKRATPHGAALFLCFCIAWL
jgi:hypothetical protein